VAGAGRAARGESARVEWGHRGSNQRGMT
jgi:hypothetical protein